MRRFLKWLFKNPIAKMKAEEALRKEMRIKQIFSRINGGKGLK